MKWKGLNSEIAQLQLSDLRRAVHALRNPLAH
jgi:hypothetical protein